MRLLEVIREIVEAWSLWADGFRFNVKYAQDMYSNQPTINSPGVWKFVIPPPFLKKNYVTYMVAGARTDP